MKQLTLLLSFFVAAQLIAQKPEHRANIATQDIIHFWEAFDQLGSCRTRADSINIIQSLYLDRASEGMRKFIKARDLTAPRYVSLLGKIPGFWKSIRPNTLRVAAYSDSIAQLFQQFRQADPGFKNSKVCFAIGCLSTGGTVSGDWLLIGTEIVSADSTTDKSELGAWLRSVMSPTDQVMKIVAHEIVHTRQKTSLGYIWGMLNHRLLTQSIREGAADFVAKTVSGQTINEHIYAYGYPNERELWLEFQKAMMGNDLSQWLYNGSRAEGRPADLGYFIGYRICESYYQSQPDKARALRRILNIGSGKKFWRKSKYPQAFHSATNTAAGQEN